MKLYEYKENDILNEYSKIPNGTCYSKASVFRNQIPVLDVSIIVPCYNSEDYLKECLDSIVNQKTCHSYEVITINDGSTDTTADILEEYAEKYSTIRVITQKNKGFSGARNRGIAESKGKYLMFVDSDDYISQGYIENLMNVANLNDADLVGCGYYTFRNKRILKRVSPRNQKDESILNGCFWGKIFRRQIFEQTIFPEGYWYEDTILAHLIYPRIKKFYSINTCNYAYRSNPNGITISSIRSNKAIDTFYITNLMLCNIEKIVSTKYIKSQEYYELLIEQFYLNERRIIRQSAEIRKIIFTMQATFLNEMYSSEKYQTSMKKYRCYEKALRSCNYKKSYLYVKLYKIIRILKILKVIR